VGKSEAIVINLIIRSTPARAIESGLRWIVLLAFASAAGAAAFGQQPADRAAWLAEARWGVMTHYLADWLARSHDIDMNVEQWNKLIDDFDVDGLATQLKSTGAGYLVLTIGQNSGYYLAPNDAYDVLAGRHPSRCSRRDLVLDIARALRERGLKLIVYLPAGAPAGDRTARAALAWRQGADRNREFQLAWERIISQWSNQWGDAVAGWWFDGCYWPNAMYRHAEPPNFESFAAAARAGNPNSAVAFNPGVVDRVISVTPFEDYTAGEINDIQTTLLRRIEDGRVDGAHVHKLSYLGRTWGAGMPRYEQLNDIAIPWTRKIIESGGAVTWDVPVDPSGRIPTAFIDQLREIGAAL
jgi:alpha-L-fucosidase